jgi:hypothetical protein
MPTQRADGPLAGFLSGAANSLLTYGSLYLVARALKISQLAAARRVALKMGRLLRCSTVTCRSIRRAVACSWQAIRRKMRRIHVTRARERVEWARYTSLAPARLGPPCRRPILIATKLPLISGDRTPGMNRATRRVQRFTPLRR